MPILVSNSRSPHPVSVTGEDALVIRRRFQQVPLGDIDRGASPVDDGVVDFFFGRAGRIVLVNHDREIGVLVPGSRPLFPEGVRSRACRESPGKGHLTASVRAGPFTRRDGYFGDRWGWSRWRSGLARRRGGNRRHRELWHEVLAGPVRFVRRGISRRRWIPGGILGNLKENCSPSADPTS